MNIDVNNFESIILKINKKTLCDIFSKINRDKSLLNEDYLNSFPKLFNVRQRELNFILSFLNLNNYIKIDKTHITLINKISLKSVFNAFQKFYLNQILISSDLRLKIFGFTEYKVVESSIIIDIKNVDIEFRPIFITLESLDIVEKFEKTNLKKIKNLSLAKTIFEKSLKKISKEEFEKIQKRKSEKGELAELFVMNHEIEKLKGTSLKPVQVSNKYVNLGYDIESFDLNGNKIYIEVKTMVDNSYIYWTKNEIGSSVNFKKDYFLYCIDFKNGYPASIYQKIKNPYEEIINLGMYKNENTGDLIVYLHKK